MEAVKRKAIFGHWRYNLANQKVYWSDSVYQILDLDPQLFRPHLYSFIEFVGPSQRGVMKENLDNCINSGRLYQTECLVYTASNEKKTIDCSVSLERDEAGKIINVYGVFQDMSEQKKVEDRINLLECVISHSKDCIIITDCRDSDKIIYANDSFLKMTGHTLEDVLGRNPRFLQGPRTDRVGLDKLKESLEKREFCELTTINYKKNGEEFWNNFSITPVFNELGEAISFIAIERNITELKNQEKERQLFKDLPTFFNNEDRLEASLHSVCKRLCDFGNFSAAEVWMPNFSKTKLQLITSFAADAHGEEFYKNTNKYLEYGMEEGLPGRIWSTKLMQSWELETNSPSMRNEAAMRANLKSFQGIPLIADKEIVGIMLIFSNSRRSNLSIYEDVFLKLEKSIGIEIKRQQNETELKNIFKHAPDIICLVDKEGRFVKMNDAGFDLLGYEAKEIYSTPYIQMVHPEDVESTMNVVNNITDETPILHFENRYITKSGQVIWLTWNAAYSPEHKLIYAVAKNITKTKELERLLDRTTNIARVGAWEVDLDAPPESSLYWSPMTRKIMETDESYNPSITHGFEFYSDEDRSKVWEAGEKLSKTGEPFDLEILMTSAKGNPKWIRILGQCDFVNEKPKKIYGSFQDIHQRKVAELELKTTLDDRNTILESIGDGFFAVNKNWVVTYWNKQAENITGRKRAEMVGSYLWEVYDKEIFTKWRQNYSKAMDTSQIVEFEEFYKDFNRWVEITVYPSQKGLSIYFKDVTTRKLTEEQIFQSNERFEKVAEATNDAIWDWDIRNNTHFVGNGFTKLFGHHYEKTTPTLIIWSGYIHPDDAPQVLQSLHKFTLDKSAKTWKEEYRYLKSDGNYATVIDRGVVIRNSEGEAVRMIGSMSDITYRIDYQKSLEKLNSELEKHAKQLERSNNELERFAFVASHDLQEPLRMVTSFLAQLERKYGPMLDDNAKTYIEFASGGARRMKQIILDLLEFSRAGKIEEGKEIINLRELLEDYSYLRRKIIEEKNVKLKYSDLPKMTGIKPSVIQVLHNLIDNAIKYSKENIPPEIVVSVEETIQEWTISVTDNGIGIEEEYYEKIFVIFQRLHDRDAYTGTGIGLSIVKKNVEGWRGKVWVESKIGQGSTFFFTLPKE